MPELTPVVPLTASPPAEAGGISPLPFRFLTLLLTDVEGSTRLWEQYPEATREALRRHDEIVREAVRVHDGFLFKEVGDAHHAVFTEASAALAAALTAQRALCQGWESAEETNSEGLPRLRVRMALYSGEIEERGKDFFGPPINRAARVRDALHGGQIVIAESVRAALAPLPGGGVWLPEGMDLTDLGFHRLRDINESLRLYQVTHPDLPLEFPALRTLSGLPNNLPFLFTSFVGRDDAMSEIQQMLNKGRLVTLFGPGGAGKTRLAVEVGAAVLENYRDGVYLAELGTSMDAASLLATVAAAIGVRQESGRPLQDTVIDYLCRRSLLLILDNCEHLLDECARFTDTLLRRCPNVVLLATSREPLGIPGEAVYPVQPLSAAPKPQRNVPALSPEAALEAYPAIRLFVDRASAAAHHFTLTPANLPAVAEICRRLDGLPLAIELAAAWAGTFTPEQLVNYLSKRFQVLGAGANRPADPRHQTLRGTIDWSYNLLPDTEKMLLRRLSVFAGGWLMPAAERICSDPEDAAGNIAPALSSIEVITALASLTRKSLVAQEETPEVAPAGESIPLPRYRLLETIREYAAELLRAHSEEEATLRERYLDYYVALGAEAEPHLFSSSPRAWLDRLETENANLRAALTHSNTPPIKRLQLATSIYWFWQLRGLFQEGCQHFARLLAEPNDGMEPALQAKAAKAYGILAWSTGDYAISETQLSNALNIFRQLSAGLEIASCLNNLGMVAHRLHNYAGAKEYYEESIATYRSLGGSPREAYPLNALGALAYDMQDFSRATDVLKQASSLYRRDSSLYSLTATLVTIGASELRLGHLKEAYEALSECILTCFSLGTNTRLTPAFLCLSELAHTSGNITLAPLFIGIASLYSDEEGNATDKLNKDTMSPITTDIITCLGESEYYQIKQKGASMSEPEIKILIESMREMYI